MKKTSKKFKLMAMTVIMALIINLLPNIFTPVETKAATGGNGSGVEKYTGLLEMTYGDNKKANILYITELSETSDGYKFELSIDPKMIVEGVNSDRTSGTNGFFTAQMDGDYLVQIMGGKGGKGAGMSLTRKTNGNGEGGAAGQVYAIVSLKAGDTLFYSIGGDGTSSLNGNGGGGNGGAGHGDEGYQSVGTGGGYSAVYLFKGNEFDSYLDSNGNLIKDTIDESDRKSKVILIAGGGGGGGARTTDPVNGYQPDGGNGGNVSSEKITLEDGSGYVFPGESGESSDSVHNYVGVGGSDNPGKKVSNTDGESSKAGSSWPNGGAGGDGNYRGGAGGAGYAGGSGGIMKAWYSSDSVGGGGGGSSFVSNGESFERDIRFLTKAEQSEILTQDQIDTLRASGDNNGGFFHISVLKNEENLFSFLEDISVSTSVSDYFDVTLSSTQGTVSGLSISDIELVTKDGTNNYKSSPLTVTMTFTRKSGFMGGNDVPLFGSDFSISNDKGNTNIPISISDSCGYVNVPFKGFEAVGINATYNKDDSSNTSTYLVPVNATDLFVDNYTTIRSQIQGGTYTGIEYAFIDSISDYKIDGNVITSGQSYKPDFDQTHVVSFEVTPKSASSKAKIGTENLTTTYSSNSIIFVPTNPTIYINEDAAKYEKKVIDNGNGTFTVKLDAQLTINQQPQIKSIDTGETEATPSGSEEVDFKASTSGYYYFVIRGGKGGKGGDVQGLTGNASGGNGANANIVDGIIYLSAGEKIVLKKGTDGTDGNDRARLNLGEHVQDGGKGGTYSSIKKGEKVIAVSGGGGGGAGSYNRTTTYKDGNSANLNSNMDSELKELTSYNGTAGSSGTSGGGTAGTSKSSYKASEILTKDVLNSENQTLCTSSVGDNAYCYIKLVEPEYFFDNLNTTYSFESNLSKYFTVSNVMLTPKTGTSLTGNVDSISGNVADNKVTISDFSFVTSYEEPVTKDTRVNSGPIEFTISYDITPVDGFLGGNDVPIFAKDEPDGDSSLKAMVISQSDLNEDSSDDLFVPVDKNSTDYVNISLRNGIIEDYISTNFKTYDEVYPVDAEHPENHELIYTRGNAPIAFNVICGDGTKGGTAFASGYTDSILDDFVNITDVTANSTLFPASPEVDTNYEFTFSVEPKSEGTKAVVGNVCENYSITKYQMVKVNSSITFELTNLTIKDVTATNIIWDINNTYDFNCTFVPAKNYALPNSVTIKYNVYTGNGEDISSLCSYDLFSGELVVPRAILQLNSIIISAETYEEAPSEKYTIKYVYPRIGTDANGNKYIDESNPYIIEDKGPSGVGYEEGDVFWDLTKTSSEDPDEKDKLITPESMTGYDFDWESSPTILMPDGKMKAQNLVITGNYVKKKCTLTINYVFKETGATASEQYTGEYNYGDSYNITSPTVAGYKPVDVNDNTMFNVISGADGITDDEIITVYFISTSGEVIINFVNDDDPSASKEITIVLADGDTFDIDLAVTSNNLIPGTNNITGTFKSTYLKNGYEIYINGTKSNDNKITGKMDSTSSESYVYNVKYVGQRVDVSFNTNAGTDSTTPESIIVQYGNTFEKRYNSSSGNYDIRKALPTPYREGYEFDHWELSGKKVTESTVVNNTGRITLDAVWTKYEYTVVLHYVGRYKEGNTTKYVKTDLGSKEVKGGKNDTITVEIPSSFEGGGYLIGSEYASLFDNEDNKYKKSVATNGDRSETIYYDLQKFTLTVNFEDENHNPIEYPKNSGEILESHVEEIYYGYTYTYTCPLASALGYDSSSRGSVYGKMVVGGVNVTVTYFKNPEELIVVCVLVEWESLDFVFNEGKWNPDTHTYDERGFSEKKPKIVVTNTEDSNIPIRATLSFSPNGSFPGISGTLSQTVMNLPGNTAGGSSGTAALTLGGTISETRLKAMKSNTPYAVGTVYVSISRGTATTN